MFRLILSSVILVLSTLSGHGYEDLQTRLEQYTNAQQPQIGIAVIIDGRDTIAVNGNKRFPMMSVFKFPLAIAAARYIDNNGLSVDDSISIAATELLPDTYSPMRDKYGCRDLKLPYRELLYWSLSESDNNAADILIDRVGGTDAVMQMLGDMKTDNNFAIKVTEADMHIDPSKSIMNYATPIAMASMFEYFDTQMRHTSPTLTCIADIIESCRTGMNRIPAGIEVSDPLIGHKTGTGFDNPEGGVSAINDCGYIHLPDGRRYVLSLFIADSPYGIPATEAIIADISRIIYQAINQINN